ncbi:MAG TPA: AmmeMemoRadiSam system protein A [Candidatus Hydrogenedentes bacterium]|jgi:AmmeMemoRadiSam system protein A|nr:MAG: hypothetical protein BWY07_01087 [Candidatus Hydrogenedentes bacterium ADurb.Bin170]HOD94455.1 AmmeMemoRadiSam system protein A [Candidatus Hydrogenedentota bacterium]HOR50134.1 AmmeMemoRadiSam system protein A [Candidatus Hydrogenedentota bacterium]HPK24169.1 AmmeMemoRadiSam system protein A [Candidatus Hydrogenedentota bacterium]
MEEKEIQLTPDEKSLLLRIARESVQAYLEEGVSPAMDTYPLTPLLKQKMGVFVTLRCAGALRGCIGHIFAQKGLAQTVAVNAVNAGFYDSRFAPLRPEELEALRFEVSVLLPAEEESPFIPVNDPGEICIGRDGLYLEHPEGRGLLLPQVPVEQGWNGTAFLEGICRKAGVHAGGWQDPGARLWRFRACVFGESED